jgi:hypothetical protein
MAAKTISNINIKLTAGTGTLQQDFARATGMARNYGESLTGVATKIAGALAGMFAVSKLTGAVRGAMQSIDDLAKSSDRLGIATEDLQAFNLAADLAGISAESLTTAFRFSQRALSEAASGAKAYSDSFAMLGLDAAALAQMKAADQFTAIVTALQQVTNQADRTRLAMDIFGRSGNQLLSMNPDAIASAAKDLERWGGAISRLDAAKVEAANDAITRTKASLSLVWSEIAIRVAPAIELAADKLTSLIAWFGHLDVGAVQAAAEMTAFAVAFAGVLWLIPKIVAGVQALIASLRAMAGAQAIVTALSGPAGWAKLAIAAGVAATAVGVVSDAFAGVTERADHAATAARGAVTAVDAIDGSALRGLGDDADNAAEAIGRVKTAAVGLQQQSRQPIEFRVTINGREAVMDAAQGLQAVEEASRRRLETEWRFDLIPGLGWLRDDVPEAIDGATTAAGKLAAGVRGVGAAAAQAQPLVESFAKEFAQPLTGSVGTLGDRFERLGKSAKDWQREADRWAKELETPGEKLVRQVAELQSLFAQRLITPDVFERGNKKIRDDYESALDAVKKIAETQRAVEATPAILQGSAEDLAAIDAVRRRVLEARDKAAADLARVEAETNKAQRDLIQTGGISAGETIKLPDFGSATAAATQAANQVDGLAKSLAAVKPVEIAVDVAAVPPIEPPPVPTITIPPIEPPAVPTITIPPPQVLDVRVPVQPLEPPDTTAVTASIERVRSQVETLTLPDFGALQPLAIEPPQPLTPVPPAAAAPAPQLDGIRDAGKQFGQVVQQQAALAAAQNEANGYLRTIRDNTKDKIKVTEATI